MFVVRFIKILWGFYSILSMALKLVSVTGYTLFINLFCWITFEAMCKLQPFQT